MMASSPYACLWKGKQQRHSCRVHELAGFLIRMQVVVIIPFALRWCQRLREEAHDADLIGARQEIEARRDLRGAGGPRRRSLDGACIREECDKFKEIFAT